MDDEHDVADVNEQMCPEEAKKILLEIWPDILRLSSFYSKKVLKKNYGELYVISFRDIVNWFVDRSDMN